MKGQGSWAPPCGGCHFPLGQTVEVAWAKVTFHVDPAFTGTTTAIVWMGASQKALQKQITGGQDVVMEGRVGPISTDYIAVGMEPRVATIWDIKVEWADKAQAPAAGFDFSQIMDWIRANPLLAAGIGVGAYLLVRGR